jgi:sulfide:quinone oxidoreductase
MSLARAIRVLVAGGVAGLEIVLALQRLAGDRVQVELLAPGRHFTYRPLAVAEPFRSGSVPRIPLAAIAEERGLRLHRDALARVHRDDRAVETQGRARLDYDRLVLAIGARPVEAVPGALTFRGPQDAGRVATIVEGMRAGTLRRVGVRFLRNDPDGGSEASGEPLWWPPAKIVGRHVAHYLAAHLELAAPQRPVASAR